MVVPEEGRFSTRPARKVASNSDCGQIKTSVVASGQKRPQISEICSPLPKWTGPGLNRRHQDFQSENILRYERHTRHSGEFIASGCHACHKNLWPWQRCGSATLPRIQ